MKHKTKKPGVQKPKTEGKKKIPFRRRLKKILCVDYRHFICVGITLISAAFIFLFPNAIARLAESFRDLGVSCAYYFCGLFFDDNPIIATVTALPAWEIVPSVWEPFQLFPWTWEEFQVLWDEFWKVLFTVENFEGYLFNTGDTLQIVSRLLLIIMPLFMVVFMKLRTLTDKRENRRGLKSHQLRKAESFYKHIVFPVLCWFKNFGMFLSSYKIYTTMWLSIWAFHFNLISVLIEAIAFYLYFIVSFDLISLYYQVLKLVLDLTPMIRFLPGIVWAIAAWCIFLYSCRSMAFSRLYALDAANRGVLNRRGVLTIVYGEMGIGKTQLVTAMGLASEIQQWDDSFAILLEKDMQFPNFPWQTFRDELKRRIDARQIVDIPSCRRWVSIAERYFAYIYENYSFEGWKERFLQSGLPCDYTFGYDFDRHAVVYNDELKITPLYEAISDYACAYMMFTVKTSLLFSNYSIRTDSILEDLGNFPLRNNDWATRDPRFMQAFSEHSHIIDFDMFRLGKKMLEENPKARRLQFGTYIITEVDKERRNMQKNKSLKDDSKEANQKNDLFESCLMMCRHAVVIANRVFIRIICDLQRPEEWGAGGRELGEIIYIERKDELTPVLPFFAPFWWIEALFGWAKGKWEGFYTKFIYKRSDEILFVNLLKNIIAKISNYYDKVRGLFGVQTLHLLVESGRMDGEAKKEKWRILTKRDRSKRYQTDCLSSVFDGNTANYMHVDDFVTYASTLATTEEVLQQHSYFQNEIHKIAKNNE